MTTQASNSRDAIAPLAGAQRRRRTLASGVELSFLDWGGDGRLMLMHPGAGHTAGTWGPLAAALRPEFRAVSIDPRGHGDTRCPAAADAFAWHHLVEDLVELTQDLVEQGGGHPVAVGMGNSMGATIVLAAAARRPALFERVVALDPASYPPRGWPGQEALETQLDKALDAIRQRPFEWPSRDAARAEFEGKGVFAHWSADAVAVFMHDMFRPRRGGGVRLACLPRDEADMIGRCWDFNPGAAIRGLEIPVCVVSAKRGYYPRVAHEMMVSSMHDARIEDVDCGHLVQMEIPERIAEIVREFTRESLSL